MGSSSEISHWSPQKDTLNSNCFLLRLRPGKDLGRKRSRQTKCLVLYSASAASFRLKRALISELDFGLKVLVVDDRVFEELKLAKQNGACGAFVKDCKGERRLSDPYFFLSLNTPSG
jgi:hypothetical protein